MVWCGLASLTAPSASAPRAFGQRPFPGSLLALSDAPLAARFLLLFVDLCLFAFRSLFLVDIDLRIPL